MTIAVVASLLLGLAAVGLGIEALHKVDNINASIIATGPAVTIVLPSSGTTVSGTAGLDARSVGPKVTAVDFLATGGTYHDTKIATASRIAVGWVSVWQTRSVPNGTYEITSVGYNASGQSSASSSVTVKVQNS
jgi:hypothetical protein